ncbi:uncharacterized protein LOC113235475 isoform X1 [Hyposmocoma kahamanoa]|uniref:uncharacterized protein LOC113235475 isoform X1 n=1 Tax=Hyposmocoma kahamanoa TaxID=1477025 RepID=UPI000E6D7BF4|nr:uncharacterized protein LOC113235475 isoform X1 [Hyposmocoma kahamanoa]
MAIAPIFRVLLIALIARCRCEPTNLPYSKAKTPSQFGELLKPPPPPLANIIPVPFHGGASRLQRQNVDVGYVYQPPPPPPPPPPSQDFKFPAPFYKQYNFNFVPPPQPFTTTPSPSLFQKVSGWLFPSQQTSYEPSVYNTNSIAPVKKDCNPCNLVPWIPVIRYNLGAKNVQHQTLFPTYGPPSPTAYAPNFIHQFKPQPFEQFKPPQLSPGVPHAVYGPPQTSSFVSPSSTYGPPSPTHTIAVPSQSPLSSPFTAENTYTPPSSSYGVPSSSYGLPSTTTIGQPSSSFGALSSTYGVPSSTYGSPTSIYATPAPNYEIPRPVTNSFTPITSNYEPTLINKNLPPQSDVDVFKDTELSNELQLPKVNQPTGFRNSYGEPITNTYSIDISYPGSATAAESNKVKTEVLPNDGKKSATPNMSLALANPAPFSRGRNIHTLQPVALPNLSVSPLPPIFNARPFRPIIGQSFSKNVVKGINLMQQNTNNVNIDQSVPLAEFTHSIDYPPSFIKSTIIDIGETKQNQSKAYRNIPNHFTVDDVRDVSSQASEDHIAATKSNQEASFESTGAEYGNDLYDNGLPSGLRQNYNIPSNHKTGFADLRGVKDEDVDKYRIENNLQNIDSPLLYLKPSAPHKDFENFVTLSTPGSDNDYELYDEVPTTTAPQVSTIPSAWDESRNDYSETLFPPPVSQEKETKPKIVQIIVPYTTGQNGGQNNVDFNQVPDHWTSAPEDEYQARKVPSNTENLHFSTVTESYNTEEPPVTQNYDSDRLNTHSILNDLYDVKEPPFDIIKLQHTIDDWTEQEYSKHFQTPDRRRPSVKYAKQIPDEYLTTTNPITSFVIAPTNYDFYDHVGSSSIKHAVIDDRNRTFSKSLKEYNNIERTKTKHNSAKNEEEIKKPYIYTAASSFRSTTTTPAPWGKLQTSISPLTKEKVYVVTAKPWREASPGIDKPNEWYSVDFESKKTGLDNDVTASDSLPFKSPRFPHRPSFGFTGTGSGKTESLKSDSSFAFSRSWYQSINELENQQNNTTTLSGGPEQSTTTNSHTEETNVPNTEEDTANTTTADPPETEGT